MAKNPPPGDGRIGAVKDRSQGYNPHNRRWVKINAETGLFMDQNSQKDKPFKGVTKK
jgi:hypothetical protein